MRVSVEDRARGSQAFSENPETGSIIARPSWILPPCSRTPGENQGRSHRSIGHVTMIICARIDWEALWVPSGSLLEVAIRGTVMYLGLFLFLRFMRRDAGSLSLNNMLLVVLVADAAQNGMAGDYHSIPEGLMLVGTIGAWDSLLNWLSFRFAVMEKILRPPPLLLIRDGRLEFNNLRRQLITPQELRTQLREQGVTRVSEVRRCFLEPDGRLSVIRHKPADDAPQRPMDPPGR